MNTENNNTITTPAAENVDKPLILVAEDTDSNYLLLSTILKKEYTLIRAIDGLKAVELHKLHNPRVILMDIKMPNMNGLEATRHIREIDKNIPIIVLTAFAYSDDKLQAANAGANDFMTKPVNQKELKDLLRKYIPQE